MKPITACQQTLPTHKIFALACLSAALGLAACNEGPAEKAGQKIDLAAANAQQKIEQATENAQQRLAGAKASVTEKTQTAGEYIDDSVVTMKVKAALLNDSLLKSSQIEVTTMDGAVRLSGAVDSEQSIGRAVALVSSQPSVKSVQTDLVVIADTPSN